MDIPRGLPRFEDERAFFIVTGKQVGKIYSAAGGKIAEVSAVVVPPIKYSDRENPVMGYKQKDQTAKKEFLKEIAGEIKEVVLPARPSALYLFTPDYSIREIQDVLPREARSKIKMSFTGNFTKFSPLDLLAKVKTEEARRRDKNERRGPEEIKILKRPTVAPRKTARRI